MGTIIYKPHCASCGALINDEVTYKKLETISKYFLHRDGFIEIEPNRCASCGEVFETIEVPMPKEIDETEQGLSYADQDTFMPAT